MQSVQSQTAPTALTASPVTYLAPGAITGLGSPTGFTYPNAVIYVKKMQFTNNSGATRTVTVYLGSVINTGTAGTEILVKAVSTGDTVSEYWGGNGLKILSGQFLTMKADSATASTVETVTYEVNLQ